MIESNAPMLEGIRILDCTGVVFGPYATQILADLGADVIKVEAPGIGDQFRWAGKHAKTPGMSPGFMGLNRGKRSIELDLKTDEDRAAMRQLVETADVFILNVRGKAAETLGLDYDSIRAVKPDIIYAHCLGFGEDGPYAGLQAYDDVIQAITGTTSLLSRVDGNPAARYLPSLIADKVAGLHAAYAVLAAIIHKLRTGEGQKIDVPMMESFAHFMLLEHLGGRTFDPPTAPICYSRQIDPDRQPFRTADGFVSIVPYTDESWPRLFEALGNPVFLEQPQLSTRAGRAQNLPALYREIARLTASLGSADVLARCEAARIPAMIARDMADVPDDPHLNAVGFFRRTEHPTEGGWLQLKPPVTFSGWETPGPTQPPLQGEHGAEIRREVGIG
ncbi:CoA transferase [Sandaracinobacter neustonicus]|uniref:CoA transferase n=1 Tax=Sandaracinobacter neustonicus TaxID=1715348 RepID=A0A501XND4_9SPHN|nr:CoA transferase [Sandaracinobacter neustonicus]TPE61793.1 CoA transferase [Sandaracinobacter neustonicus]